jgi:hypothetical protein
MAGWVCDPGKPPAVFVCRGADGGGTCGDRVVEDRLGVIDDEQDAAGRAAGRPGVDALAGRACRQTRNAASPMASWATMSWPSPARCSSVAPMAAW